MPKSPKEKNTRPPHEDDQPIDDMLDGGDIHQWSDPFGQVVSYIHASLYEVYSQYDREAMEQRRWHRAASLGAIGFGTAAILLSLVGVVLEARGIFWGIDFAGEYSQQFWYAELAFFVVAVGLVIIGKWQTGWHENWLVARFCAEEYRTWKFRALLQGSLYCNPEKSWNERFAIWKTRFDSEVLAVKNGSKKNIGQCIVSDTVSSPPPGTCGFSFDEGYLREMVNYYRDKRLKTQIDFFDNRFDRLEKKDKWFRKILSGGFIVSILLVAFKLVLDLVTKESDQFIQSGKTIILMIMLSLPIIAFAVRTLRSSTEVARSASLYRANRNALVDFRNRLNVENERDPRNWEEIIKILWECENHLEKINHEWVRIMKEAEWFV